MPKKWEIIFSTLHHFYIFLILQYNYWSFFYCSPFYYCSSNFVIAKVFTFGLCLYISFVHCTSWLLFCIAFCKVILCPTIAKAIVYLLKALAKSKGKCIANAFKSEKEHQILLLQLWEEQLL